MYSSTVPNGDGPFHSEHAPRAGYRREFEEMENRIRKCERQRAELERQFAELMHEREECERAAARAMKQRKRRMMEAERQRAERNESILRMLNKVDQQAVSLAAKTDRLKMLKTQYEMYLMRTWSSSYSAPMITAPPVMLPPKQPSSRSEFVQYLTDLTHQQSASIDPIPPPMALSNYLASQQKPHVAVPSNATVPDRPCSRAFNNFGPSAGNVSPMATGYGLSTLGNSGTIAKKIDMSNEDFIRYIDSEVLKEPIPKVSILPPSPDAREVKQTGGAYLEDAPLSEDEQLPIADLSEKLEQFSMLVENVSERKEPTIDLANNSTEEKCAIQGGQTLEEVTESGTIVNDASLEMVEQENTDIKQSPQIDHIDDENGLNDNGHHVQELHVDPQAISAEYEPQPVEELSPQIQPDYNTGEHDASLDNVATLENNQNRDTTFETPVSTARPELLDDLVSTHQEMPPEDTQSFNRELIQQTVTNHEGRNHHWTTARDAMKTKIFPGIATDVMSSVMNQNVEGTVDVQYASQYESTSHELSADNPDPNADHGQFNAVVQHVAEEKPNQDPAYPEYSADADTVHYQTDTTGTDQNVEEQQPQTSSNQGYHDGTMGHPVEYQESQYQQPTLLSDEQQSGAYPYTPADGQQNPYADGQYVEAGTTEQYQYQEGVEQTAGTYDNQEAYQAPDQTQYPYDENAQYYSEQQGYEGQYYTEDPQQPQQYYADGSYQQQQHDGQYAQQVTDENPQQIEQGQPDGQTYYPPDGQQYESIVPNSETQDPSVTLVESIEATPQSASEAPPIESSAVIDSSPPKDKQDNTADLKTARKEAEPSSDPPTLSTVNDESDFDFSTQ